MSEDWGRTEARIQLPQDVVADKVKEPLFAVACTCLPAFFKSNTAKALT
jgi:hypothetical protein